jgi:hypothetical protein
MCLDNLKLNYKKLCAKTIKIEKSELTPILFETYNENDYYYVINNNYNHIYSMDEVYSLVINSKKEDPFTRIPIVIYEFVKIKFID